MYPNAMHNYQYVMEYDTEAKIDPDIIHIALNQAWRTTPSKQQMMPYSVFVLGPEDYEIRLKLYYKCVHREYMTNNAVYDVDENDPIAVERAMLLNRNIPQYGNLKTAPYVFLFTQRVEDKMNPWNQNLANKGWNFEQADAKNKQRARGLALIEIGMFAQNFGNYCLQNNIDISHTRCLPTEMDFWSEPEFSFLDEPPQLIMSAGKGLRYRRQIYPFLEHANDHKPDFDRVVRYIEKEQ